MLIIAGLGPGDWNCLSLEVLKELSLKGGEEVWLRTKIHPVADWLKKEGYLFQSFDYLYDTLDSFEAVYEKISNEIIKMSKQKKVVYAVPGSPFVAEKSVKLILEKAKNENLEVKILPAMSFLDAVFSVLKLDPVEGFQLLDGLSFNREVLNSNIATIITQVYNPLVASEVKLSLLEYYPDEYLITVIKGAGIPEEEKIDTIPLYELDRLDWIDHLTCVYLPKIEENFSLTSNLDGLAKVMKALRSENGCPWDKEQNHNSLRRYLLEESYEVLEAIRQEDMDNLCEELGDLLLQIVFHAQIASENNYFELDEVIKGISEKMIRRHPHVFGEVKVENSDEVLINWDKIKQTEKGHDRKKNSVLDGVTEHAAALLKAQKIQHKAAKVGFDWENYEGALEKVYEELEEVKEAIEKGSKKELEDEIGDAFFALVNVSRLLKVDAETSLLGAIEKFKSRFQIVEGKIAEINKKITDFSLKELDVFWEKAKRQEKI